MKKKTPLDLIIEDLGKMRTKFLFNPGILIGKTTDFNKSAQKHQEEGLPVMLRIAEGTPIEIANLEKALIEWARKDKTWTCLNTSESDNDFKSGNCLYICLDTPAPKDELCEYDEVILLDTHYPIDI